MEAPRLEAEAFEEEVVGGGKEALRPRIPVPEDVPVEYPEKCHLRHSRLQLAKRPPDHVEVRLSQRVLIGRSVASDSHATRKVPASESQHGVRVHRLHERSRSILGETPGEEGNNR